MATRVDGKAQGAGIGRRALMRGTVTTAALGALAATGRPGRAAAGGLAAPSSDDMLAVRLRDVLRRPASAARLGQAYLEAAPAEADARALAMGLAEDLGGRERVLAATAESLAETVSARCRDDFAAGRTVRLQGWVLSRTEVRLCALAALPLA
jgi:hypothetical protein